MVAYLRPWLNWIEHLTTDQKVEGSNPSGRAMIKKDTAANAVSFLIISGLPKDYEPDKSCEATKGSKTSRLRE